MVLYAFAFGVTITPLLARKVLAMAGIQEHLNRLIKVREDRTAELNSLLEKRESILTVAEAQGRQDLNAAETTEYRQLTADIKPKQEEILNLGTLISEQSEELERSGQLDADTMAVRKASGRLDSIKEPTTYSRENTRASYLQDVCRVGANMDYTGQARERLMRHAQDVETSTEKRYAEMRDLSRVDGAGGYAVPPLWMMDDYVELARPGRALANLVTNQPLPPGTDSINIPKLLTGAATGVQTADNTNVVEQDITDTSVNAPVRTIAGQQDVAVQLLDQSPIQFDQVIFRDLIADYAAQVDGQVIAGTGAAGQVLGLLATAGIITVASAGVTIANVYSALADAVQRIHTTRRLPPQAIVMHPRRWAFFQSLLDTTNRPLFLPAQNNPMNAAGIITDVAAEQVVGNMHGLPVITDPNLPTNLGAGTNQDPILIMRATDHILWESGVRTRAYPETLSGQLTVRLQVFGYLAFTAARFAASTAHVTGLIAPTF